MLQGVVHQVFVLRLLRRLVEQRRIGRRILRHILVDSLDVAGVGNDRRETLQRVKKIHRVTPLGSWLVWNETRVGQCAKPAPLLWESATDASLWSRDARSARAPTSP